MMSKRKIDKRTERGIRSVLLYAINTIDKKGEDKEKKFINGMLIHRGNTATKLREYKPLRDDFLPWLLTSYIDSGRITVEQEESLLAQLQSPDRENWYLAFVIIDSMKSY